MFLVKGSKMMELCTSVLLPWHMAAMQKMTSSNCRVDFDAHHHIQLLEDLGVVFEQASFVLVFSFTAACIVVIVSLLQQRPSVIAQ